MYCIFEMMLIEMFEKACMEKKFVKLYAQLFVKAIKEDSYKNIKDKKKG